MQRAAALAASSSLTCCHSMLRPARFSALAEGGSPSESSDDFDVCVVGAGIVGMTTAERLVREGLKVCVIDKHGHAAAETSMVSSGQLEPKRVDHLVEYSDPTALGIKGILTILTGFPRWTLNYLNYERRMKMTPGLSEEMTRDIHQLGSMGMEGAEYWKTIFPSVFRFGRSSVTSEASFPMDPADPLFLDKKDKKGEPVVTFRSHQIASGSPYDLCQSLEKMCKSKGAVFMYNTEFRSLAKDEKDGGKAKSLETSKGSVRAKRYVFCTGIGTDKFFPMLPMWGIIREYAFQSKTAGLFGSNDIIMSTLPKPKPGQQSYVVVVENEGGKRTLRLGGGAEVSTTKPGLDAFAPILERVGGHGEPVRDWIGCRAVSPDGAPIIGLLPGYDNVYVNSGQSFWGWTLSFGSAEVLSNHLVKGKALPRSFSPSRFI